MLNLVREKIVAIEQPSFVKDSELRYVAVNSAYARIFNLAENRFTGRTDREVFGAFSDDMRDDRERRVVVFGEDESLSLRSRSGELHGVLRLERFLDDDDSIFIFGFVEPAEEASIPTTETTRSAAAMPPPQAGFSAVEKTAAGGETIPGGAEQLHQHLESLMMAMPVGILILDETMRIEYVNAAVYRMVALDDLLDVVGMSYRDYMMVVHTRHKRADGPDEIARLVEARVAALSSPDDAPLTYARTPEGLTVVVSNRKLADGKILVTYTDITELAEREEETALYRATLEQMPVPVFIRDAERKLIYVNSAYEVLHDQRREDVYGLTEDDMFPESGGVLREENLRILEHGEVIERPRDVVIAGGREISVITRLNRITTTANRHYLVGSVTDVSVIKEHEQDLSQAHRRAETLYADIISMLRIMPVGVVILNEDLIVEFANEKCREIWCWPADIPIDGLSFRDYCEINIARGWNWPGMSFEEGYQKRVAQFRALEGSHTTELAYDDGKYVLANITRLNDRKILLTYSDLTEMRRREKEIGEAREQLERLGLFMQDAMALMSQGLVVIENDVITDANQSFSRILDLPAGLADQGQKWYKCFQFCAQRGDFGDDPATLLHQWQEKLRLTTGFSTTFLANGKTWVQMEVTFGGSGHWVVVLTDVSEIKEREAELEVLLAKSEAADKAKSEFLANMSHEIRTPMNGVLGMAELLSKSILDTRQKTFVDIIVKSGNALLTIINDILDFSKIDAGQLRLRKAPFDPVEAIEDVATLLSAAASEKDIELLVSGDQAVRHTVLGDPGRFRQIVTNLVGNAIKFTEKGHVLIDVSTRPLGGGESLLQLRIEDTGIGIAPEMQLQIFDKFSQVDSSSTRRHEGTGLGLAITSGLVNLFGGSLSLQSEPGHGSTFTVEIPMQIVADRNRQKTIPASVKDARVLVIDDNAVNRRIVTEQLSIWGFDGLAVEDGETGLKILAEAHDAGLHIDVVIIDYHMPAMNGIEVARAIRSDSRFDDLALIFLTSMDIVGDDQSFQSLKVQAHLMKPARANLLKGAIIDVVRAAQIQGGLPLPVPVAPAVSAIGLHSAPMRTTGAGHMQRRERLKVLIAEDNQVNQIVFRQILSGSDIDYRIVGNGEEALNALNDTPVDLILMDVSMPVMNGHQAAVIIRAQEARRGKGEHVPIIGVTAHALDSDREACLASGMDDYLSKPISPELLMRKIEQWRAGSGRSAVRV
ncbi:PAS-domain containing protein [Rhizobium sp. SL42]|uniref:PAS-domain containing protein n=1 Tax=Rhizobium sp. SL42 TaxID=2806346 RepID=UPI001F3BE02A|nr:PAS-domain containing protein [Rhizobium sp. SL42]UJW74418.1 PAS-domain containing protein [Rhizobium sp. SL42]